ncbi:MAG: prephenate dehydrogenase [Thermoguttaceae bacterium]
MLISRITIIGVGLLGASIAAAVKKRNLAEIVVGIDPNRDYLDYALHSGLIDQGCCDINDYIKNNDVSHYDLNNHELLIICSPVGSIVGNILEFVKARQSFSESPLLITDVGSTKNEIWEKLQDESIKNIFPQEYRYIGSHPIAGSEKSGPENADPDLFIGKLTILTSSDSDSVADVGFLELFWNLLGSTVILIPPDQHDEMLARTSHLPHLIAAVLIRSLQLGDHLVAGPGFRSTTRLASGNTTVWKDIFTANRNNCIEAIKLFEKNLKDIREMLEKENFDEFESFLVKSKKFRDSLGQ